MIVLIDSRATHNFISKKLVIEQNIPIKTTKVLVVLGDDRKVRGIRKCEEVKLTIQRVTIQHNFLPFILGSVDIILGVDWLNHLGEVNINWRIQTMRFEWDDKGVNWCREWSLLRLESSFRSIAKIINEKDECFWVELGLITEEGEEYQREIHPKIA